MKNMNKKEQAEFKRLRKLLDAQRAQETEQITIQAGLQQLAEKLDAIHELQSQRKGIPRKERRLAKRLAMLPQDRICKSCGRIRLKSKAWVMQKGFIPICRACYNQGVRPPKLEW